MYRALLILLCLGIVSGEQLEAPRLGYVRYAATGKLSAIFGVFGAFIPGLPLAQRVEAASFSNTGGLLAFGGQLHLFSSEGRELAATDAAGPAVLNIDSSLTTAIAWIPGSSSLVRFSGTSFETTHIPYPPPGRVLSVQLAGNAVRMLIDTGDGVSEAAIDTDSGNLLNQNFLPDVHSPALYAGAWLVYRSDDGLEFRAPDGRTRTFPAPAPDVMLERISTSRLHLWSPSQHRDWAVEFSAQQVRISELPGGSHP